MIDKNNETPLLPCPCCPSSMVSCIQDPWEKWFVECGACGMQSGHCTTEQQAISLWNTRAPVTEKTPIKPSFLDKQSPFDDSSHQFTIPKDGVLSCGYTAKLPDGAIETKEWIETSTISKTDEHDRQVGLFIDGVLQSVDSDVVKDVNKLISVTGTISGWDTVASFSADQQSFIQLQKGDSTAIFDIKDGKLIFEGDMEVTEAAQLFINGVLRYFDNEALNIIKKRINDVTDIVVGETVEDAEKQGEIMPAKFIDLVDRLLQKGNPFLSNSNERIGYAESIIEDYLAKCEESEKRHRIMYDLARASNKYLLQASNAEQENLRLQTIIEGQRVFLDYITRLADRHTKGVWKTRDLNLALLIIANKSAEQALALTPAKKDK